MTQGNEPGASGWDTPRRGQDDAAKGGPAQGGAAQGGPAYGVPQYPSHPQQSTGQPTGQPDYGHQQYGQPNYSQPNYSQPGHQQQYGQPGYGQPGYGQPGASGGYGQPGQDPAFAAARKPAFVSGLLSTIFGAVSTFILPLILGVPGLVLGIVALQRTLKLRKTFVARPTGGVLALAIIGVILSALGIIGGLVYQGVMASL